MKIPITGDPIGRATIQTKSSLNSGDPIKVEPDEFLKLLKSATMGLADKINKDGALPPDKEKLQMLVRMLSIQMSHNLISSALLGDAQSDVAGEHLPYQKTLSLPPGHWEKLFNNPEGTSKSRHIENSLPPQKLNPTGATPDIEAAIGRAAGEFGVQPDLIRAVIKTESGFNPQAVSPKGAKGLMQLMPATARELGVSDPFNPEVNIRAGTRYLKGLLNRYDGNVNLALAAYNWGMGNVEKNPGRYPRETLDYVARVNRFYQG